MALWQGGRHGRHRTRPLGRVTLVTGKEEFLGERTVVRGPRRGAPGRPGGGVLRDPGGRADPGHVRRAGRAVAVQLRCAASWSAQLEDLPDESVDGLLDYAAAPAEDVALVLVHSGGAKGSGVLTKLRKLPAVTEAKSAELRP